MNTGVTCIGVEVGGNRKCSFGRRAARAVTRDPMTAACR
jgi:hypothetical protein